jgi:transcription termination/antitermination protein NusA
MSNSHASNLVGSVENSAEIKQSIDLLCAERGVTQSEVVDSIEIAIAKAYRKDFGEEEKAYDADYDLATNTYNVFETITVTDQLDEEGNVSAVGREISLMAAKLSDPSAEVGKVYKTAVDQEKLLAFGRVATGIAKQSMIQYIRNLRHNKVIEKYVDHQGEIITVEVDYYKKNGYYVKLDQTTVFLSQDDLMPFDKFKPGSIIKVHVDNVVSDPKYGLRITLKRNTADFVVALIKAEIPEVSSGQIEIVKAVREAGLRTKILVQKEDIDMDIDPVGTILGRKEVRILNIARELNINMQERIDIIEYHPDDIETMILDALEPARINKIVNTENGVIVLCDKSEAALAVGRRGGNVRLASQLLDIEISVEAQEISDTGATGEERKGSEFTLSIDDLE